jgi:hypothetical protein
MRLVENRIADHTGRPLVALKIRVINDHDPIDYDSNAKETHLSKLAGFNNLGLTSGTYSFNRNGGLFAEIRGAGFLQVITVFILSSA